MMSESRLVAGHRFAAEPLFAWWRRFVAVGVLAGGVGAGCGSSESSCPEGKACACDASDAATSDQETGMDVELSDAEVSSLMDFCAATWGVQSGIYATCCSEAEQLTEGYKLLRGVADAFVYECQNKLTTSAAQGRIALQAEAAAQCAGTFKTTLDTLGCQMLWTGIDWEASTCRGAVTGKQGDGAPCRYRYECESGLFCFGYTDGTDGTCGAPPAGGSCRGEESSFSADDVMDSMLGQHPECESGMACLRTSGVVGVCAKTTSAGGNCVLNSDCDQGLRCYLAKCGTSGPVAEGGACRVTSDCVQRLYCSPSDGGENGTCTARKGAGESCTVIYDECRGYCAPADGGSVGLCMDFCSSG
jgi:hypothetical protein